MKKFRKISDSSLVPIISDGAIATHEIGEGRMVPVLVVDCTERVELRDLIYAHEYSPPGDVTVTWAVLKRDKSSVALLLEFSRPSALEVLLQFNIKKQGGVVDGILHANALYLQPSESGLKVVDGLDKGKILVEIPDTGFLPDWEKLYTNNLVKTFKKSGFSRREAKEAAEQHKSMLREIWSKRMKRS
ncbi:hypothetical protein [Methylophaga frappieri]|uniref:hypothetical protein n=1 Tax=Methylophaga frappieri (strain ATCC BAA-2434 / DSM 25690 / JAM7) TaxID=754477 RepID=UPI00059BE3BB|nr:hypothetical protein [Methylophaga frappieri]